MKLWLKISILFAGILNIGMAQQLPQYSQFMFNKYAIHSGFSLIEPYWEARSNHRYQWERITDGPRTYTLSIYGPNKKQNMGFGLLLFTDFTGPTRRSGIQTSYNYALKLSGDWRLIFSAQAGILQFMIDGSKITLRDENDPLITNGVQATVVPDIGSGLLLHHKNKFYLGISAPQIIRNKIKFFKDGPNPTGRLERHFYGIVGYLWDLSDDFSIEPNLLLKYVEPVELQWEPSMRFIYKKEYWIGASYRYQDAIAAYLGFWIRKTFLFGYSYDYPVSNIRNYSTGTHEVMLGIKFIRE